MKISRSPRNVYLLGALMLAVLLSGCSLFSKPPEVDLGAPLQDLRLSAGNLGRAFEPRTFDYTATVPGTEQSVRVRAAATTADTKISVSINGEAPVDLESGKDSPALPLEIGDNVILVNVVRGTGGQAKEYTYKITVPKEAVVLQEGAGGYMGLADAQISRSAKYTGHNMGGQTMIEVGYTGPWFRDAKFTLMRFDLSAIPADATVSEASVNLRYFGDRVAGGVEITHPDKEVYMHQILVPWNEGNGGDENTTDGEPAGPDEVSWQSFMNGTPYDSTVIDSNVVGVDPKWYAFDLSELAAEWISGAKENYGVLFKTFEFTENDHPEMNGTKQFRSSEYSVVEERPYLRLIYTLPLEGITLDTDSLELVAGKGTAKVTAFPRPLNAEFDAIEWTSSNESVATVINGTVTPVAKGEAEVTATISAGAITYSAKVTVVVK